MGWEHISEFWYSFSVWISSIYDDYYLGWVITPIFLTVFVPVLIGLILYVDIMIILIYTLHWGKVKSAYGLSLRNGAIHLIAAIWEVHSRIWHDYEVFGMDKIPKDDPALLVCYHGAIPVDCYYLSAKIYLNKSRIVCIIADNFLFKLPGFRSLASSLNIVPGSVSDCASKLKEGALLAIYPGGVFESQFGDSNYKLMWRNRLGFAKVALEAKVNIREAFVALPFGRSLWMKLYSWTRLPLVPVLGEFPVKLRTIVGDPIPYEAIPPEELKVKVMKAMEGLIIKHQRLPGSIFQGLLDRFRPSTLNS